MDSIEQDIYYSKHTPKLRCFEIANLDLNYFELNYIFGDLNDSVGKGTKYCSCIFGVNNLNVKDKTPLLKEI